MASGRHFFTPGTLTTDQLKADIKADITASRGAEKQLREAGQHKVAEQMRQQTDEHLDELGDANSGTWQPKHNK